MDDGHAFLKAAAIIESSLYVDDILFGDDDFNELRDARNQLIELMNRGGLQLRKWADNSSELLADIPLGQYELIDHFLAEDDVLNVPGLSWLSKEDSFCFAICSATQALPTKRSILSFITDFMTHSSEPLRLLLRQKLYYKNSGYSRAIGMIRSRQIYEIVGLIITRIWHSQ